MRPSVRTFYTLKMLIRRHIDIVNGRQGRNASSYTSRQWRSQNLDVG